MGHILKHHIKPTSSLLKKNMDFDRSNFDHYNNVENLNYRFVNINAVDIDLNEVSDHSDFSDTEVVQPYFDFESSMNIEDMMNALDKDIIFSNDEPIPENDNSFDNSYEKFEMIVDNICKKPIENTVYEEEYQPESPESCTSDEDFNSTSSDEDYEPTEPQKKSQPQKRISKKPAKYQSTDEEYHTSESETEEQTEKRRVQCRKAPNIAHWLLTLLDENSSAIGWTHNSHGEFKILKLSIENWSTNSPKNSSRPEEHSIYASNLVTYKTRFKPLWPPWGQVLCIDAAYFK